MNLFKRATLSLISTVDKTVSRLEDHDALVSAKVNDISRHIASSKLEIIKVDKANTRLLQQITTLQQDMNNWERRATEVMHNDRDKALACLQRRNHCEAQLTNLDTQRQQQQKLKQDMQARLLQMQNRLAEVKQQQTQLRNRSSQAEIERIASQVNTSSRAEVDDVFQRWEETIITSELSYEAMNDAENEQSTYQDTLETQFLAQEEQAALNAQLDALLQTGERTHD